MAIYTIGDLHLSKGAEKPMDVFPGWENYMEHIENNWLATVSEEDTVVLVGDTSWGMNLEEALPDFLLLNRLPGKKIIVKGNHDFWWGSVTSMHNFFFQHNITTIDFLHNNHYIVDGVALCGSRGWMFETGEDHDAKIVRREAIRIENSIKSLKDSVNEIIVFLHYPPIYGTQSIPEIIEVLKESSVKRCYYGHIHGDGHRFAKEGYHEGIEYSMISADYIDFTPQIVKSF